nr:unnamed protein product [Callosobruchus chinensis]
MRYGHLGKHCKSKPRCTKCFESHPTSTCTETIVKPQCFHCSESHYTYEIKKCDEFKRQQNIKKHMAITNCSYKDAERDIPKVTYAKITQNSQHNPHQETNTHFPTINNFPSTSRANSSSYFTQTLTKRPKRNIPISPDPTEAERQKIISQPSISHREGGITSSPTYLAHIRGQCDEPLINNVLELVIFVLSNMKEIDIENLQKADIINLIRQRLDIEKDFY